MKNRPWLAAIVLVFLSQCSVEETLQDTRLEETHKEKFGNYYDYLDAGEPNVIALSGGRAKRDGAILSLELANKKTATFTSCKQNVVALDDSCFSFHLMAVWPSRHSYLVHKGYVEDGVYLLISDRDGAEMVLEGPPDLGPDISRFIVLTAVGMTEPAIRIYKFYTDRFLLEWSTDGYPIYGDARPVMLQWTNEKISLEYRAYHSATEYKVTGGGSLVRKEGKWQLLPQN